MTGWSAADYAGKIFFFSIGPVVGFGGYPDRCAIYGMRRRLIWGALSERSAGVVLGGYLIILQAPKSLIDHLGCLGLQR